MLKLPLEIAAGGGSGGRSGGAHRIAVYTEQLQSDRNG